MNILVTGGTGVVGSAAIPALLEAGHKVRLLSRHAERDVRSFPEGVDAFPADVAESAQLADAVHGCDVVLHIAGIVEEDPPEITFAAVNVEGTRHLLDAAGAAANRPFFVYLSSLGADRGGSGYHHSKRQAEELVEAYPGSWLIVRPGSVYGPGDEAISTLLKMVRTLPAVPVVSGGEQPFQPLWYLDLGAALVRAVAARHLAGRVLEVAGPDVTTTDDVLRRLMRITGRRLPTLNVPVWITEVGVQALEAFGGMGRHLLERTGIESPLNSAKLAMLLEENVLAPGQPNGLVELGVVPTSLEDGLHILVDLLPEQLPGDGVGAITESTYAAEIVESRLNAVALLDAVCERVREIMPLEFAAEPGAARTAQPGRTLTAAIPARGNIQVKLEERTPLRATFVTVEGHPLAGVVQLHVEELEDRLRFNVHIAAQPANAFDWLAMRTIGRAMQVSNWREVVRRVVQLSGGRAPAGVHFETHPLDGDAARDIRRFAERIVQAQVREQRAAAASGAALPARA